jgi:hypothetical protein
MKDSHLAIVIEGGRMLPEIWTEEYRTSLDFLQAKVGGYIETAFRVQSPSHPNRTIDAYVNEEGLLKGLPPSCGITWPFKYVYAGPLVLIAGDNSTGETHGLTEEEIKMIGLLPQQPFEFHGYIFDVPILTIKH